MNSDLQPNAFLSNIAHSNALPGAVFAAAENIITSAGVISISLEIIGLSSVIVGDSP
jgi:hypothetical protein